MEVMSNTYTTSFPRQVVSRRCASNCTWLSIILASILDQLLWYIHFIITYYCILLQTWGFQLHFVADVDALDVYRLLETWTHSMSTGSCWPSILTVIVKRSFNLRYQTFFGLRTNSSTPGGPLPSLCIRSCWARKLEGHPLLQNIPFHAWMILQTFLVCSLLLLRINASKSFEKMWLFHAFISYYCVLVAHYYSFRT